MATPREEEADRGAPREEAGRLKECSGVGGQAPHVGRGLGSVGNGDKGVGFEFIYVVGRE